MAYLPQLRILHVYTVAGDRKADVVRCVAGIVPGDIETFVDVVAVHLGGLLNIPAAAARSMLDIDLGDEQDCKPIGCGGGDATIELRAFARLTAAGIAAQLADLARSAA